MYSLLGEYKSPFAVPLVSSLVQVRLPCRDRVAVAAFGVANGHIKKHLEGDWKDVPVEHITIDSVNEWIWKKRKQSLSWATIKNVLRTLQRVLSSVSKDKKPPFSQNGLAIPERDKLKMKIDNRQKASFSWEQTLKIVDRVRKLDNLGDSRKEQYSTLFLLAGHRACVVASCLR